MDLCNALYMGSSLIDDINQLENMPLHYIEKIPKQDLTGICYGLAGLFISLLLAVKLYEAKA